MRQPLATYLKQTNQSLLGISRLVEMSRPALQRRIDAADVFVDIDSRGKLNRIFVEKPIRVLYERRRR